MKGFAVGILGGLVGGLVASFAFCLYFVPMLTMMSLRAIKQHEKEENEKWFKEHATAPSYTYRYDPSSSAKPS